MGRISPQGWSRRNAYRRACSLVVVRASTGAGSSYTAIRAGNARSMRLFMPSGHRVRVCRVCQDETPAPDGHAAHHCPGCPQTSRVPRGALRRAPRAGAPRSSAAAAAAARHLTCGRCRDMPHVMSQPAFSARHTSSRRVYANVTTSCRHQSPGRARRSTPQTVRSPSHDPPHAAIGGAATRVASYANRHERWVAAAARAVLRPHRAPAAKERRAAVDGRRPTRGERYFLSALLQLAGRRVPLRRRG
jgi:hypothetical protein